MFTGIGLVYGLLAGWVSGWLLSYLLGARGGAVALAIIMTMLLLTLTTGLILAGVPKEGVRHTFMVAGIAMLLFMAGHFIMKELLPTKKGR